MNLVQLGIGFVLGVAVAFAAYKAHSLNRSGAIAAAVLGTVIFGLGGLAWAVLLLAFFISSSALSRAFARRKAGFTEKFSKGSERDWAQVMANGGVAGIFALLSVIFQAQAWVWWGFAGSLAAVNADTWATELGVLGRSKPRMLHTFRRVEPGTSGAISLWGTVSALAGAGLIALLGALFPPQGVSGGWGLLLAATVGGMLGSLVDSLLGATVQVIYTCPVCNKETERHPRHLCGAETVYRRGWRWLDNDWVNTICAVTGAVVAIGMLAASPDWAGIPDFSGGAPMTIQMSSSAFTNGGVIPQQYTCDGQDLSPALSWSGLPAETKSLVLIMDDPDAPMGTFTHWVVYNIPVDTAGIAEGGTVGTEGPTSFGKTGYGGPCPPRGKPHRYFFRLYALDDALNLKPGLNVAALRKAMEGHVLAAGEIMGIYGR